MPLRRSRRGRDGRGERGQRGPRWGRRGRRRRLWLLPGPRRGDLRLQRLYLLGGPVLGTGGARRIRLPSARSAAGRSGIGRVGPSRRAGGRAGAPRRRARPRAARRRSTRPGPATCARAPSWSGGPTTRAGPATGTRATPGPAGRRSTRAGLGLRVSGGYGGELGGVGVGRLGCGSGSRAGGGCRGRGSGHRRLLRWRLGLLELILEPFEALRHVLDSLAAGTRLGVSWGLPVRRHDEVLVCSCAAWAPGYRWRSNSSGNVTVRLQAYPTRPG